MAIAAMAVGIGLLIYGLAALRPSVATNTAARGRGSLCRLSGCSLFALGFLFWCNPHEGDGVVLGTFGGAVLLLLLAHRLLWSD